MTHAKTFSAKFSEMNKDLSRFKKGECVVGTIFAVVVVTITSSRRCNDGKKTLKTYE